MLIGILQTGHAADEVRAEHGDYDDMFGRLLGGRGLTFRTWNVVDMDFPASTDAADGWLITGSRHGAYEDHPWIGPLEDSIRAIVAAGKPLVGICFGHQIIAQALGGRVEKSPKGWGVGRQFYSYGNEEVSLNAWHQDQVVQKPEMATTVARNAFCEHAALVYGRQVFTVQAHPEFSNAVMAGLIEHRGESVPADRLDHARSQLEAPNDSARIAGDIADFFLTDRTVEATA
ncbi:type 1 glutamine amidotransferase [Tropicimonas sp. IMCC34011]|uniref:type 1 glutamine amidotransferase n=1 Tax=Tropicimonas sp. IMCC34011 TaxID=2248759 RepID=UPI000E24CE7B|nr:type 1 glutamine amidotransferase [Tropicimonas sp. IMCC34011]